MRRVNPELVPMRALQSLKIEMGNLEVGLVRPCGIVLPWELL